MGDVFDRIVSRAATGPVPPAALTMRRTPGFGAPDDLLPVAGPGESETRLDTGASARRAPLPLDPSHAADRPPDAGWHEEPESEPGPRAPRSAGGPAPGPAAPRLDREGTDAAVPDPAGARLTLHDPATAPARGRAEEAPAPPSPGRGRAPAEAPTPRIGLRARPRQSPPRPAAEASPTRTVSAPELLRGHVAPVLEARGLLGAGDDATLTSVGLDPLEVPADGDVHVHLGHVEVVQQVAAAPAPEPSRPEAVDRGRERVDHADYLARQQRRWS